MSTRFDEGLVGQGFLSNEPELQIFLALDIRHDSVVLGFTGVIFYLGLHGGRYAGVDGTVFHFDHLLF